MRIVADLKVGDNVAVTRNFDRLYVTVTVDKVTATQAVMSDGSRWLKSNDNKVGGSYRDHITTVEDGASRNAQHDEEILRVRSVSRLNDFSFRTLSDEQLARAISIIEEYEATVKQSA